MYINDPLLLNKINANDSLLTLDCSRCSSASCLLVVPYSLQLCYNLTLREKGKSRTILCPLLGKVGLEAVSSTRRGGHLALTTCCVHVLPVLINSRRGNNYAPVNQFRYKSRIANSRLTISNRETQCSAVQAIRSRLYLFDAIAGYSKTGWSLSLYELELVSLAKLLRILVITDNLLFCTAAPVDLVAKPRTNNNTKAVLKTASRNSSTESTSCSALGTVLKTTHRTANSSSIFRTDFDSR